MTEIDEPQAVIGSDLHRLAYPRALRRARATRRQARRRRCITARPNALAVQARGEYLYIADGEGGFKVFDIAQINQKGFSEKIVTAPVSPLGQNTERRRRATRRPSPRLARSPSIRRASRLPENEEQPIHPLLRATSTSPIAKKAWCCRRRRRCSTATRRTTSCSARRRSIRTGGCSGARNLAIAGNYAYILCDRGLVIVNIDDPLKPRDRRAKSPRRRSTSRTAVAVQFRYAFITDADGLKVVDITVPEQAAAGRPARRRRLPTPATSTSRARTRTSPAASRAS